MRKSKKTLGIIQARMTSTRLPGKVLMEVMGRPLLAYQVERLRRVSSIDELVVATTINAQDDPIVSLCDKLRISTYRGSEHDVLSRYYEAATSHNADTVVRFTSDCPLIDPGLSDRTVRRFLDDPAIDYCATDIATYPRGVDTEVFSYTTLAEAFVEGTLPQEREHVTYFIYTRPGRYRLEKVRNEGANWGQYRLTVDTPEDLALIQALLARLYPVNTHFTLEDVIALMEEYPHLSKINASIKQKHA